MSEITDLIESVPCSLNVHTFSGTVGQTKIHFQVLQLEKQLMVWIGGDPASLSELAFAAPPQLPRFGEPSTLLIGQSAGNHSPSELLSARLAKNWDKHVYVSCNLPKDVEAAKVEQILMEERKNNPNMF